MELLQIIIEYRFSKHLFRENKSVSECNTFFYKNFTKTNTFLWEMYKFEWNFY